MDTRQLPEFGLEPEYSPLHNPILARNLDRWAHIYAAAPPQGRAQAIRQLLADLQSEESAAVRNQSLDRTEETSHPPDFACRQCGRMNEAGQMYCGFCGAETPSAGTIASPHAAFEAPSSQTQDPHDHAHDQAQTQTEDRSDPRLLPSTSSASSLSSRQLDSLRELSFSTIYDPEESSHSGWKYAFAVLVVIVCLSALAYVQWKTQIRAAWDRYVSPPASATAQTEQPAAGTTGQNAAPSGNTNATPSDNPAPLTSSAPAAPEPAPPAAGTPASAAGNQSSPPVTDESTPPSVANLPSAAEDTRASAVKPASKLDRDEAAVPPPSAAEADNGTAELAVAQEYLNGSAGARNPSQAATWLWKAVGKKNPEALVLLSDLYSHGDGVPKNCDQARLLLMAAVKKGAPNSGAKLRDFESGHCR